MAFHKTSISLSSSPTTSTTFPWINNNNLYPLLYHLQDSKRVGEVDLQWVDQRSRSLQPSGEKVTPGTFLVPLGLLPNLEDLHLKQSISGARTKRVLAVPPKPSGRPTVYLPTPSPFFLPFATPFPLPRDMFHGPDTTVTTRGFSTPVPKPWWITEPGLWVLVSGVPKSLPAKLTLSR